MTTQFILHIFHEVLLYIHLDAQKIQLQARNGRFSSLGKKPTLYRRSTERFFFFSNNLITDPCHTNVVCLRKQRSFIKQSRKSSYAVTLFNFKNLVIHLAMSAMLQAFHNSWWQGGVQKGTGGTPMEPNPSPGLHVCSKLSLHYALLC